MAGFDGLSEVFWSRLRSSLEIGRWCRRKVERAREGSDHSVGELQLYMERYSILMFEQTVVDSEFLCNIS